MSEKYYPAAIVRPMLKAASTVMHQLMQMGEEVRAENDRLTHELSLAKAAAAEKVTLEKVAKAVDADKASEFATFLEARGIIPEGTQEKYASACASDANTAVEIAMRAIKAAEAPSSQGCGVKSASKNTSSDLETEWDLWQDCVR
jgi:hypothetical protein